MFARWWQETSCNFTFYLITIIITFQESDSEMVHCESNKNHHPQQPVVLVRHRAHQISSAPSPPIEKKFTLKQFNLKDKFHLFYLQGLDSVSSTGGIQNDILEQAEAINMYLGLNLTHCTASGADLSGFNVATLLNLFADQT